MNQYYSLKCYWNVKFGPSYENVPIKPADIGCCNVQETVSFCKDYHFIVTFTLRNSQDTKYFLRHHSAWVGGLQGGNQGFNIDKLHRIFRRKISVIAEAGNRLCLYMTHVPPTHCLGRKSRQIVVVLDIIVTIMMTTSTTPAAVFTKYRNPLRWVPLSFKLYR